MKTENPNTPIFGTPEEARVAPKFEMPKTSMPGEVAYQLVHDEAMMDGNARLNLATFVTTWMDDYARRVMTENMDKNMIDKTEYPQTAEIERRCVNIIAKLWHSPEPPYCTGTSTVGSSEACMLGGIAALKRWQKRRRAKGLPTNKPNFIISTCMQVVWEKFAIYWDVEMRMVPVTMEKITMDPQDVVGMCDENTICVVPIQGVTITGLNDNVKEINDALDKLNAEKGWEICIHVDAATGGFIHPFIDPDTVWDFRLKWVLSISVSGHKFGLVYPGVGWVVWKDKQYLPEEMNFAVNYLGANIPSISINFSRPGNQVLAQYYQFMLRWPAEVKPGAVSDALVCQMDLLASLSALIGQTYSDKVDSQNTLPVFLGKGGNGRKELVLEGYFNYALRDGDWVMIPPYPDTYGDAEEAAFAGNSNCYQLYNVKEDIGQQVNLAEKEPKRLRQMMMTFERLKRETGKITNF